MNKCDCGRYINEDERECEQCILDEAMDDSEADAAFRELEATNNNMYICIGCKKEETEEKVKKMGLLGNGKNTFACNECTGDNICPECESTDTENKEGVFSCNKCGWHIFEALDD